MSQDLRERLIAACRILDAEGLGDLTRGHVSIRIPGDPTHFYMKPHSRGFDEVTVENIVTCNLDGEKVGGSGRKHSEVYIHSEIYKARADVNSVIHVHPTHAVALSATGRSLRPISQPSIPFCDGVPVFEETMDLIRSQAMGTGVAKALGAHKAVLMRSHGVAVVGATVDEATILTIMLENACQIQLLADATGSSGSEFPADDIQRLHRNITAAEQYSINFDYLARRTLRQRG
jgi:L-fuculose-phosphate aldolase